MNTNQPNEFGTLISQKIASESDTFYHHYDALGSTAALTDSSEVVTDEYAFEAFGETAAESGATPNPYQWVAQVGYRKDEETSLYDLRRRNYDVSTGRFISEDPVRSDEENLYRYVGNRPTQKIDPSGLDVLELTKKRKFTDRWGKRIETPEHNSPVFWNVLKSDYIFYIPSIPYATDSLLIGKYDLSKKSVILSEEFGGGELPLEFLQSYAANESAIGQSGTSEVAIEKTIEEAKSVHAYLMLIQAEYNRLSAETPKTGSDTFWEWFYEVRFFVNELSYSPPPPTYEEETAKRAEINVLRNLLLYHQNTIASQYIWLEKNLSGRAEPYLAKLAREQAKSFTGLEGAEIAARLSELTKVEYNEAGWLSNKKVLSSLTKFGLKRASLKVIGLVKKIGSKGIAKFAKLIKTEGKNVAPRTVTSNIVDPKNAPMGGPNNGKYVAYHGTSDSGATSLTTKGIDSKALQNPDEFNLTVDPTSAATFGADEVSKIGGTVKLVRYEIPEDLFHDLFQKGHIKVGGVSNSVVLDQVAQDAINKAMGF